LSTTTKNSNATLAQIRAAAADTRAFIDALRRLRVVVFCGRKAQLARAYICLPTFVQGLSTFHPGAMSYNHRERREHIERTFKGARGVALSEH
jgi:hypothetical protein